jgi:hypothetical protein
MWNLVAILGEAQDQGWVPFRVDQPRKIRCRSGNHSLYQSYPETP